MRRLINWFNILIKKRKELKRWQRIVTVLAAVITFATTYALILPAITVEKDNTGEVAGMYLEKTADLDVLQEENALEPIGVSIAADMHNAVTFAYSDEDMTATAVFSTDEEIPEGTELVVNLVAPESEEYADLRSRSVDLLDKEFIYDVTTCSFYDYALICDNVDVTPKTGLVDIHIVFRNNTVEHVNDMLFAGRFTRPQEEADGFTTVAADVFSPQDTSVAGNENAASEDSSNIEDELVSANSDDSSVIELADGIITSLALKGNDLARNDSIVGILAGNVDEETKAAAAETDAEIPDNDGTQEESEVSGSAETDDEEISTALPVKTLKASGSDYTVTLSYDESSGIPDEAVLDVSEIAQDSEEYQTYLKEAKKAMGLKEEETLPSFAARFFDIKIMVGNQEFIPETGVSVEITYNEPLAEHPDTEVSAVHFADESAKAEVIEANTAEVQDDGKATVEFTAESFSVYGVIYTVDFHYEVDGKMYEFSIPGGGFASFYKIVEVLGISNQGIQRVSGEENAEIEGINELENSEIEAENGENTDGNAVHNVVEEADVEDIGENTGSSYEESISLNNVEVSEATKNFVADVASVEFSSPELVWVGKVDEETTVGGLKEANGLEVQYSAELTEEQIAEINETTVESGDWALISVLPFSSEESLKVTMMNGDCWTVKVTDGQRITNYTNIVPGREYIIYVVKDGNQYYALRNNGSSEYVGSSEADLESLGNNYIWNYGVDPTACWWYSGYRYLNVDNSNDARTVVGSQRDYLFMTADDKGGFDIYGYNDGGKHLSWDTSGFKITNKKDVSIRVYMKDKKQFDFTVAVNNDNYGSVSCAQTITNENKTNKTDIVATVKDGCYFSGWRLGDEELTGYGQTIRAGTLQFPEDNMRLTALFGKNYTSQATQEINEWVDGLLGNPILSDKTAHVYDYDNRIYEVDISASSMRYTINSGLTLEFITDASRSMYFPAEITPATQRNGSYVYNGTYNLEKWLNDNVPESERANKTFFVVGDVGASATMYAVYWGKKDNVNQWLYVDASYYNAPDGATRPDSQIYKVSEIPNGKPAGKDYTLSGTIYTAPEKVEGKDWNRLDYLRSALLAATRALYRLDPSAQIGLVTFAGQILAQPKNSNNYRVSANANNEGTITNAINSIWTQGGTNQRTALMFYCDSSAARKDLTVFTTDSTRKQVAILITDGAPNESNINWTNIGEKADSVRARNVDLYTLGLSLDNVGEANKNGLNGIAGSASGRDLSYAFQAENGEKFAGEIEKMLLKILDKATLVGQVTDTIDPAFYPVDINGNPISSGTTVMQSDGKRATYVENADGSWTVTYNNAEIGWPAIDSDNNPILDSKGNVQTPGWKTSIYIKAKEDFMGGNKISTNTGMNDQVTATGYKQLTAPNGVRNFETPFVKLLSVPYVNVDELSLTENSTEWRVYLGTDVDPEDELLKLWNKIRVSQVVKDNGIADEIIRIGNRNQMYYNDARDNDSPAPNSVTNETLPLSHFVNSEVLTGLIRQLDNEETTAAANLTYRYFPYGHDVVGTFDIELTKTVNEDAASDYAPALHTTKEVGENKEVYTLKVTYNPMDDGVSTDYGKTTTDGKSAGKVADGYDGTTGNKIESENIHKIHVFAKDLEIQKKDMTNTSKLIDTAKFKLYRTAKRVIDPETGQETNEYESGTVDLKVDNEMKKVVQIGDEMTTSGGKITVEDLSYAPDGVYYLEETKAPDGYIISESPMTIRLTLKDEYRDYKDPKPVITDISDTPYNWTQTVQKLAYANSKDGTGDEEEFVVEVLNNPGVELPSTGGPGTTSLYLLGIMLTGFAGAGLVMRKRRRDVA